MLAWVACFERSTVNLMTCQSMLLNDDNPDLWCVEANRKTFYRFHDPSKG